MNLPSLSELPAPPPGKTGWPWTDASLSAIPTPLALPSSESRPLPPLRIVTPSYNQGRFIEATIRSVLLQGYPSIEYVVVDGGSTDETLEIIRKYEPWIDNWVSEPDDGQSDAINKGFVNANCRMMTWLNSDDLLLPGALYAVGYYVARDPQCTFLTGDGVFSDENATRQKYYHEAGAYTAPDLLDYSGGQYLPQPSVFFGPGLYQAVGGVNNDLHYAMDLDLWIRMRTHAPLHYLDAPLSILRQHDAAKTLRDNEQALHEVGTVVRQHLDLTSRTHSVLVLSRLRRQQAQSACRQALHCVMGGEVQNAFGRLLSALRLYPPILSSTPWLRVAARLVFPSSIQALFLHRPAPSSK